MKVELAGAHAINQGGAPVSLAKPGDTLPRLSLADSGNDLDLSGMGGHASGLGANDLETLRSAFAIMTRR